MSSVRRAIDFILEHQDPFPAFVMNRHWDVLRTNAALARLIEFLKGEPPKHANIVRQVFDPADMRPMLVNWEEIALDLIRHLHSEVAAAPSDATARALLEEALAYPGVPAAWRAREPGATPPPLLTTVFRKDGQELRFFSTLTTFGTPRDITLAELRIESMFPADDATAEVCRELARSAGGEEKNPDFAQRSRSADTEIAEE
jgi:hypothetical protein